MRVTIEFGVVPVRLPDIPDRLLHMVVVRGFGRQPMMLLTTLAQSTSREALWQVVEGYITRWRVEDTIRPVQGRKGTRGVALRVLRAEHRMTAIRNRQIPDTGTETPPRSRSRIFT